MTYLEAVNTIFDQHLVIFFLLFHKHIPEIKRDGIEEDEWLLLFPNDEFVVSLDYCMKLEEDLRACLYCLGVILSPNVLSCQSVTG